MKNKVFLQQKEKFYSDDVEYDEELKVSNNISTLSNAKSQQIQVKHRLWGVLEPQYPLLSYGTNKVESMWKRIIGKVFKPKK